MRGKWLKAELCGSSRLSLPLRSLECPLHGQPPVIIATEKRSSELIKDEIRPSSIFATSTTMVAEGKLAEASLRRRGFLSAKIRKTGKPNLSKAAEATPSPANKSICRILDNGPSSTGDRGVQVGELPASSPGHRQNRWFIRVWLLIPQATPCWVRASQTCS